MTAIDGEIKIIDNYYLAPKNTSDSQRCFRYIFGFDCFLATSLEQAEK